MCVFRYNTHRSNFLLPHRDCNGQIMSLVVANWAAVDSLAESARAGEVVVRTWERRVSCWSISRYDDNQTGRTVVER